MYAKKILIIIILILVIAATLSFLLFSKSDARIYSGVYVDSSKEFVLNVIIEIETLKKVDKIEMNSGATGKTVYITNTEEITEFTECFLKPVYYPVTRMPDGRSGWDFVTYFYKDDNIIFLYGNSIVTIPEGRGKHYHITDKSKADELKK